MILPRYFRFLTHRCPTDLALLPAGQWVRRTNLPSAADFQFADYTDFFDLFGQIYADFSFYYILSADETYSVR